MVKAVDGGMTDKHGNARTLSAMEDGKNGRLKDVHRRQKLTTDFFQTF